MAQTNDPCSAVTPATRPLSYALYIKPKSLALGGVDIFFLMIEALHHQEAGFQLACIGGLLQDPGVSFLSAPKARQIFWTLVVFILKGPQFILGPAAGPQCTLVVYGGGGQGHGGADLL